MGMATVASVSEALRRTNWPGRPMNLAQHYFLVEEEEEERVEEEVEEVEKDEGSSRSRRLYTVSTAT